MNAVDYVEKKLTIEDMKQILIDYEVWSKEGFIGECTLRKVTKDCYPDTYEHMAILGMDQIVKEVALYLAYRYIELLD